MKHLITTLALFVATSAFADPDCPEVVSWQYHVDRTNKMCVGCAESPWATEESIAEERRQAALKLESALKSCASVKEAAIRQRAEQKVLDAKIAACAKRNKIKPGEAKFGMTTADTRLCGWGEPEKINSTSNPRYHHEQWVYGDGNYLYFENGRLTTIQN